MRENTALLHQRFQGDPSTGGTLTPIAQTSAFRCQSAEELEAVCAGKKPGYAYSRIGNPTINSFEVRMAALEGGVAAVACSSGMAAVSMALLNILEAGDEIIAGAGLFGGTLDLFHDLEPFGITTRTVEHLSPEEIEPLLSERTKVIFGELIGNPKLDVIDIPAVSALAHERNIPLFIDSTTATPILAHPLKLGADVVIHSTSKYINGSGSGISGVIIDGGTFSWDFDRYQVLAPFRRAGKLAFTLRLREDLWRNFGACAAPSNLFLNSLGLETLGLRMERLCANALGLARFLEAHPGVGEVRYPGLESSPFFLLVQQELNGMGGAIVTARLGSKARAYQVMNHLKYAQIATNIGDVRTLVIHPASTIYLHSSESQRRSAGVYDDLIRISVGIEDLEDLKEDFAQALAQADSRA